MRPRKDDIEARFGTSAEQYAQSESHRGGPDLDRMIEIAAPSGDEHVLDVATGAGNTALAFASLVGHIVALDLAEGMIAVTRSRFAQAGYTNAEFVVHDVEDLPFADGTFDIVTCRIAPHHFLDINRATGQIARVVKRGGRYMVVDSMAPEDPGVAAFLHEAEVMRDPTHVKSLARDEWVALLQESGLSVEHVEVFRKRHDFDAWVARGGTGEEAQLEVRKRFLTAGVDEIRELAIERNGVSVGSFSDPKLLLVARK